MTDTYERARDAAAHKFAGCDERPKCCDCASDIEISYSAGSDFGRAFERERQEKLVEALNEIACWHEGDVVTSSFDCPYYAKRARAAIAQYAEGEK